ncbi:hypothetical protein Ri1_15630 [Aeromonas dhakensis]|nr:hypothetical protein Ri1_15630 [Aeromonas dhakensis]
MLGRAGLPDEQVVTLTFPLARHGASHSNQRARGEYVPGAQPAIDAMFSNMTQAAISRVGRDWQCGVICLSG